MFRDLLHEAYGAMRHNRRRTALTMLGMAWGIATVVMLLGKDFFGRLRPAQLFESGDWSHPWFAGGVSFPSGHLAFYAGFLSFKVFERLARLVKRLPNTIGEFNFQ